MDSPENISKIIENRERKNLSLAGKIIIVVGITLCCQFFVCGIIGVIRGYSIQSRTPVIILLVGLFILLPFIKRYSYLSYLYSFMIIYFCVTKTFQGHYKIDGDDLYDQGNYQAAMYEYKKETETWYSRLSYNYHEAPSMLRIAECYAQLEEFDQARATYKKASEIFEGYYQGRGRTR